MISYIRISIYIYTFNASKERNTQIRPVFFKGVVRALPSGKAQLKTGETGPTQRVDIQAMTEAVVYIFTINVWDIHIFGWFVDPYRF